MNTRLLILKITPNDTNPVTIHTLLLDFILIYKKNI